jgi:hypothetical protein
MLEESKCWKVSGVRTAEEFFRAVPFLLPDATHMFLEGNDYAGPTTGLPRSRG